jgi:hypothetical protein
MRKKGLPSPDLWDALAQLFLEDASYIVSENSHSGGSLSSVDIAKAVAEKMFADII